ncbi:MAG TPA: hypothetical protein VMF06_24190 [Candidatus Limnocylindria bacterium]|nr:hypothetical protein [Candidatus Limnocylindria bacterium]
MKSSLPPQNTNSEWVEAHARLSDYFDALRRHGVPLPAISVTDLLTRAQSRSLADESQAAPGRMLGLALAELAEFQRNLGAPWSSVGPVESVTGVGVGTAEDMELAPNVLAVAPPMSVTSMVPQRIADTVPPVGVVVPGETQAS